MKRIILSLLFATAAFGQISVQKKQDGSNQISNGPVVVGSNNSITATGTGIIAATAIPSISIITTAPLTGGAALTGNLTLAIPQSSGSVNGYLSSGDWTIFNTKQPAGSYITALTGDGSAAGPGSAVFTLATVLGSPGSVGTATNAPVITFDAKGRATETSTITITPALGSITGLGTGVAAFLATPSSANLATAITDETGTGALVFGTSPTLETPHFGSIVNTGTLTLPTVTDTLIGRATTDVLTNKSISGSTNTLTNIPNSALTNQGITLGTTVVNLGGTITSLAGINSITAASGHDYVAQGGDNGASLTLGQGVSGQAVFGGSNKYIGTGIYAVVSGMDSGEALFGMNLYGAPSGAFVTPLSSGVGYAGITLGSDGVGSAAIRFFASGSATTAGATITPVEVARFARTTGNLLIGTTTDISGSGGLSVAGAGFFGGNLTVSGTISGNSTTGSPGTGGTAVATQANADAAALTSHLGTFAAPNTADGAITWTSPVLNIYTSAASTRTYTLPAASTYANRAVILNVAVGTGHVNLQPASGAQLVLAGVLLTADHYVQAATTAPGNYICFISDGTNWTSMGSSGTWADASSP